MTKELPMGFNTDPSTNRPPAREFDRSNRTETRSRTTITSMVLTAAVCLGIVPHPTPGATLVVDPAVKYQKFEGFGTSLCWWAVLTGSWSEANRNKLIGALVDPDTGLGYNCFRYNIGGGDQPGHTHLAGERAVPGFKATEASAYDWKADQNQRNILLGIAARKPDAIFEAFSNSPPWWMTISGCVSGNTNGADNLKPTYFTKFAEYLADVTAQYKTAWGITFRTVEPFNEPSAGWWKPNGTQEGCGFKSQQPSMVKELGKQLVAKKLYPTTKVSAGDETSIASAVSMLKTYDDSAFSYMSQINTHSYDGWSSRGALYTLAQTRAKNLWQSETGPLNKGSDASDITMWMSDVIIQDLRNMKPNAWLDWQVSDPSGNWATIQTTQSTQTFKYTGRYYMHAAFSRFIRPGSQFISSSDANSVAALVPNGDLVIVLRNATTASIGYTLDLTKFASIGGTAKLYRFSLPGSLVKQPDVALANKQLSFNAPSLTLTTIVVPGAAASIFDKPYLNAFGGDRLAVRRLGGRRIALELGSRGPYAIELFDGQGNRVVAQRGYADQSTEIVDLEAWNLRDGIHAVRVKQNGLVSSGAIVLSK